MPRALRVRGIVALTEIQFYSILRLDEVFGKRARKQEATMSSIQLATVKIFYDQQGVPREVLLSYDIYREMLSSIRELAVETEQAYFWTERWQAMELLDTAVTEV